MIPRHLLDRLHRAVQRGEVYLAPADALPERERSAALEIHRCLRDQGADAARELIQALFDANALGAVARVSALHVVAASPEVRDFAEAFRLADQQEFLALREDGSHLLAQLASADRHRGVVTFLMGHYEVALDWFSRAFERERTAENLGNVLATLLATGSRSEAAELLETVRESFPGRFAADLQARILADDDLRELRTR
jgi:tetratricopeptide (TPR) repeat protein